jgi:hypothetical protein
MYIAALPKLPPSRPPVPQMAEEPRADADPIRQERLTQLKNPGLSG